jgi:hypothetical protein
LIVSIFLMDREFHIIFLLCLILLSFFKQSGFINTVIFNSY